MTTTTPPVARKSSEATPEQMHAILARRIWRAHRMSVEDYYTAKRAGTLQRRPIDSAIEVFTGERAARLAVESVKRARGKGALRSRAAASGPMRKSSRRVVYRSRDRR